MPPTLKEILQTANLPEPTFTVGTVAAVDEATLSVDVTPDDAGEDIKNVPLRVMRYADRAGVAIIPAVGTQVIVGWLAPGRPTVVQVQVWTKIVALTPGGRGVVLENNKVYLGARAGATHGVAYGDRLASYLALLKEWLDGHKHGGPGTVPTTTSPDVPAVASGEVFTS